MMSSIQKVCRIISVGKEDRVLNNSLTFTYCNFKEDRVLNNSLTFTFCNFKEDRVLNNSLSLTS